VLAPASSATASPSNTISAVALSNQDSLTGNFSAQFDRASEEHSEPSATTPRTPSSSGTRVTHSDSGPRGGRKKDAPTSVEQSGINAVGTAPVAAAGIQPLNSTRPDLAGLSDETTGMATGDSHQGDASAALTQQPNPLQLTPGATGQLPGPAVSGTPAAAAKGLDAKAPLSFATKIQSSESSSGEAGPQRLVLSQSVSSVASAWKKTQHDDTPSSDTSSGQPEVPVVVPANNPHSAGPGIEAFAPPPTISANQPNPITREVPLSSSMKEVEAPATLQAQTSAPLNDVSFRIAQPDGSAVQLRLVQQAGELRVAVHAASPDLNQGLRDNLADLTKKLSDNGYHSETWRPGAPAATASADAGATKDQSGNQNHGDTDSQSRGSQQGRGQRDQNQSQRPRWVDELDNGITSTSSFQGDLNGFTSQRA
jgi:hypothetical protein